jgi:hypothetical protein
MNADTDRRLAELDQHAANARQQLREHFGCAHFLDTFF